MGRKHRVVGFDNSGGNLRTGRDGKRQLGLAAVVSGKTLQKEGSETGSGTSSGGVEDEESLKSGTVVGKLSDAVQDGVNNLLSNGVVTAGVVVGSILLSRDDLLGVVELGELSGTDFVADVGFQIHKESTRDVLSGSGLAEEGVARVIGSGGSGAIGNNHITRGADSVFHAVEFPALFTGLDTGLTDMDRDTFTHDEKGKKQKRLKSLVF
mmetsp:Transcript_10189/g.25546  ORF Transcript_10189/g.25546 Transcript_10189/m.25546 type:complete len:210 (-) Transcript_10189:43-672(-)